MDLGLKDQVYVLTGASRGLGFATGQALVADGAKVVLSARDPQRLASAVESLTALGGAGCAVAHPADLSDPAAPQQLVEAATATFGRLDGALVSVGGPPPGTVAQVTDDQWRAAFESVFLGVVRAARTVAAALPAGGAIALVLSSSTRAPVPGLGLSNGFRPGLAGAAKDLATEYAPRGVRVVSLLPHRILTDRSHELFAATGDPAKAKADVEAQIPLGRLGDPAEFGRVAAFMLSPAASYLTGITVPVDGGAGRGL